MRNEIDCTIFVGKRVLRLLVTDRHLRLAKSYNRLVTAICLDDYLRNMSDDVCLAIGEDYILLGFEETKAKFLREEYKTI